LGVEVAEDVKSRRKIGGEKVVVEDKKIKNMVENGGGRSGR
jgi:hypothetical protein